jgi:hypothetical protein
MRLRETRPGAFEMTATRAELTALMAAARMTLELLRTDPRAPAAGRDLLAAVLRDYDAALAPGEEATIPAGVPPAQRKGETCTS